MNTVQKPGEFDTKFTRIPDDSFILLPDKNDQYKVLYFYERERTRKNPDRDAARIFTYWQWYATGVFKEEADDVRILFEMTTEERMINVCVVGTWDKAFGERLSVISKKVERQRGVLEMQTERGAF